MAGALDGVVVLDLTTHLSGPFCGQQLGDLGADVIKIESPQGDSIRGAPPFVEGEGAPFMLWNRNKRGVTLNLDHPEGRALLRRMYFGFVFQSFNLQARDTALAELWAGRAQGLPVMTPEEAVVLASIVEKETAIAKERPMVAGVYANRLRAGMMLQADPTIIYPITRGKPLGRRIRKSEIAAVNDYNTYAMTGLPKGPITNPGKASIEAVLHPARTDALYMVADGTGGHAFAVTLEEHNRNVARYRALRTD